MRPVSAVLVCSLALSAVAFADPAATSTSAQALFDMTMKQGRDALVAGRVEEARGFIEQACPSEQLPYFTHSRAGACYHHLGVVAMRSDRTEAALETFRKAAAEWQAAGPEYMET